MNSRAFEILDRLETIDLEAMELRAELQEILKPGKQKRPPPPIELKFGKNVVIWDGGAVPLAGVSYKIVKILYESNGMKMKEGTLGRLAWGDEPKHKNFKERIRRIAEKLERAKFPYRLLPVMSKEKTEPTGEKYRDGRPKLKHIRPEIIGVKLNATSKNAKVAVNVQRFATMPPTQGDITNKNFCDSRRIEIQRERC